MTTDERIAALEAEVERLKARDARRESEHIHMLETRREVEDEHARDYNMLSKAGDDRFAEAKGTIAEIADAMNIGIHNEKVLVKGQQLLARQFDEHTQALNALHARVDDLATEMDAARVARGQIEKLEAAMREVLSTVTALRDAATARRGGPPRDPNSN